MMFTCTAISDEVNEITSIHTLTEISRGKHGQE